MQLAALYSALHPSDTSFESLLDDHLTALEAQPTVDLKTIITAKRALLGVVKTVLWEKIEGSVREVAFKIEELEAKLFSDLAELVPGERFSPCDSPNVRLGSGSLRDEIQSIGMELAQSAAHLSAKVASETQLLRRYQSLLTSNQAEIQDYRSILKRSKDTPSDSVIVSEEVMDVSEKKRNSRRSSEEGKMLPLRKLLEVIAEVYEMKDKSDSGRGREGKVDTLADFLQMYLDTKYGLKVPSKQSLRDRSSSSISCSIQYYQTTDCDVALFDKLLHHQVDESYRDQHYIFKAKVEAAIKAVHRNRKDDYLSRAEAGKCVELLFPVSDQPALGTILTDHFRELRGWRRGKDSTVSLPDAVFTHIVLKHRLQQYEKQIESVRSAFERCDSDSDGRLTQAEFVQLLGCMAPQPDVQTVKGWLKEVDPGNLQVVSFSKCVSFFASNSDLLRRLEWR